MVPEAGELSLTDMLNTGDGHARYADCICIRKCPSLGL